MKQMTVAEMRRMAAERFAAKQTQPVEIIETTGNKGVAYIKPADRWQNQRKQIGGYDSEN